MGPPDSLPHQSWLLACFLSQSPGLYNFKFVRFVCVDVDLGHGQSQDFRWGGGQLPGALRYPLPKIEN